MITDEGLEEADMKIDNNEFKRRTLKGARDDKKSFEYLNIDVSRVQVIGKEKTDKTSGSGALTDGDSKSYKLHVGGVWLRGRE